MGLFKLFESEEERVKREKESEEQRRKFEESQREYKEKLEKKIEEIRTRDWVKYALKTLAESDKYADEGFSPETQAEFKYERKARKIAAYIEKKEKSRLKTSKTLTLLKMHIETLATISDLMIDGFPKEDEPPEYGSIRKMTGLLTAPKLFGQNATPPASRQTPCYPENNSLRKLAKQISIVSEIYYDTHLIAENQKFISDDDSKATPATFFSIKRITEFVRTLADDQTKYRYLLQMKQAFFDDDKRGFVYRNEKLIFKVDKKFQQSLENLINPYEKILGKSLSPVPNGNQIKSANKQSFTLRQKALALVLLTFGRLDIPEDLIKERVVEFFYGITGENIKNLQDLLKDPTAHKQNKQSIKLLCNDLHFVRDHLGKLGLSDNVKKAINEIEFLIEELEEKEQKP